MTRGKGSKNKPKVDSNILTASADNEGKITVTNEQGKIVNQGVPEEKPEYLVVTAHSARHLQQIVIAEIRCYGYVCQGGVSVTSWQGILGREYLYAQAMVRRD